MQAQSIAGTATDAVTGQPLGNAIGEATCGVVVFNAGGGVVAALITAADGTYQTITQLPGIYFVEAYDTSGAHVTELHDDFPCVADECVVTAGTPVLDPAGTIFWNPAPRRFAGPPKSLAA